MYCLKISKDSTIVDTYEFATHSERKRFLLSFGFVDDGDVWYHPFSKEMVGLFYKNPSEELEAAAYYNTCDKRVQRTKGVYIG